MTKWLEISEILFTFDVSFNEVNEFRKKYGEGTDFDLDWGKLAILALCIYIAIQVS